MTDARRTGRSSQPSKREPEENLSDNDKFGLRFSQLVRIAGLVIALYQGVIVSALHIGDGADLVAMGTASTMMSGSLVADYFIKRRGKGS